MSRTQYQEPESPLGLAEILDVTFLFVSLLHCPYKSVLKSWLAFKTRTLDMFACEQKVARLG